MKNRSLISADNSSEICHFKGILDNNSAQEYAKVLLSVFQRYQQPPIHQIEDLREFINGKNKKLTIDIDGYEVKIEPKENHLTPLSIEGKWKETSRLDQSSVYERTDEIYKKIDYDTATPEEYRLIRELELTPLLPKERSVIMVACNDYYNDYYGMSKIKVYTDGKKTDMQEAFKSLKDLFEHGVDWRPPDLMEEDFKAS